MIQRTRLVYATDLPGTEHLRTAAATEFIREDEVERALWRLLGFLGLVLALSALLIGWEYHAFDTWYTAKLLPAFGLAYALYYRLWLIPRSERGELPIQREVAASHALKAA